MKILHSADWHLDSPLLTNRDALGHIHRRGSFRVGKTTCAWPGCPMGRGFDEQGQKGVYLVTLEDRVRVHFISLDMPQFHDLTVEITGDPVAAL